MDWIQSMQQAVAYMEGHLLQDIHPEDVAAHVFSAGAHFGRIFHMIAGLTVQEYIRNRRLTLAAQDVLRGHAGGLDLAEKYRYETPESFAKAFARFHGAPPSVLRREGLAPRCYAPLTLKVSLSGGFTGEGRTLAGVPFISQRADGYAYLTSFVGALYAALYALGEDYAHEALLFASGLGNRICWTQGRWIFGNEDPEHVNPAPFAAQERLMRMVGWNAKRVPLKDGDGLPLPIAQRQTRRDFVRMLDRGVPVIAQGITDDGCKHDYDVFYGYESGGERIIGWDFYQQDDCPLVRADWEGELASYVLLLERDTPWTERERTLGGMRAIVSLAHQGTLRGRAVGFAAWEALLADLAADDFAGMPLASVEGAPPYRGGVASVQERLIIYCDALCQINDRRQVAAHCRQLAPRFPQWAGRLTAAAEAWAACADYGGYLWSQGLSFSETGYARFQTQAVRDALAAEGRRAYALEREAVAQVTSILAEAG